MGKNKAVDIKLKQKILKCCQSLEKYKENNEKILKYLQDHIGLGNKH